jgi:hypothetical protein
MCLLDLPEGQRWSKEGYNVSCRFRNISREVPNGFQPYYTHTIPTCPRCAFWSVRHSAGQKKVEEGCNWSCLLWSIFGKALNRFQCRFLFYYSAQPVSMPFTFLIIIYLAASMYTSMYIGRGVFRVLQVYLLMCKCLRDRAA